MAGGSRTSAVSSQAPAAEQEHREQAMQQVEIRVKGRINEEWSEWLGGLTISHSGPDGTVLTGRVQDQAALYGIISRLRDLGLELSAVSSDQAKEDPDGHNQ
jgi:hypothetical protein